MPEIKIQPAGKIYHYEAGGSLLEILLAQKIFVDNPCNGKGVCGKCRVRILSGDVPEVCETERKLLREEEWRAGIRLSCLVRPECDLEIELLTKDREGKVLTGGYVPEFSFAPDVRKQSVESGQQTEIFYRGEVIGQEEGDTSDVLYGVAIDIGTTTVVCSLIDMISGKELANASMINAQKHFGLDVLTRITYELEHPKDGVHKLQTAIVRSINAMIGELCVQACISRKDIYEITVGANCTMMHMLLGVDATSIGRAPYKPAFVESRVIRAAEIGIEVSEFARLYCLPNVSAYIGADIAAGAYVCGMKKETGNVLFIDIGTNGEIVLSKGGNLLCCSCAAGPALEGMNISSGMRAADGAIEDVRITASGVELDVIGGGKPVGVCGSGILAAVRELVRHGIVTKSGAFVKKKKLDPSDYRYDMIQMNGTKREFILTDDPETLLITQGDIRQVQLAKGAILSGFLELLDKAGIGMSDLDKVLIAGQFGAHLPADSLTGTGILPKEVEDKIVYVGNSSRTGAYMALMSGKVKTELEDLAKDMDYMELGAVEGYERLFSECLLFPVPS